MVQTQRFIKLVAAAALLAPAFPATLSAAVLYDFEGLTTGATLTGQDNWVPASGSWAELDVATGTGVNTTTVGRGPSVINSAGNRRQNDLNFNFGTFTGTETNVVLQADMRLGTSGTFPPIHASMFGVLGTGGVRFGMTTNSGGTKFFAIRRNGSGTSFTRDISELDASFGVDDWMRVQLEIDLTANGGEGAATLLWMNLTDGDASFSGAGAALTNVNLNILSGGDDPTTWDDLFLRVHDGAMIDNLSLEGIPEPSTVSLLALGLAGLLRRRRRMVALR